MAAFPKAKVSFAFLLGYVLFAATDAHAMKVSEVQKLPLKEQAGYVIDVIDAHLKLIAQKDLDLFKKTELEMYKPSTANGLYQGVVDIMANFEDIRKQGGADKVDVERICRFVLDVTWKEKGWTHDGKIANSKQFFPNGYQVAYNPPKKDGGSKNIASAPAKPDENPVKNGVAASSPAPK